MSVKQVTFPVITGIGAYIATYCSLTLHHTVFLDKYKDFVTYYRQSIEVRLSDKLKKLCEQVLEELKLPEEKKPILKPFHVFGFDIFHAGTLNKTYGAVIGIPYNFTYTSPESINRSVIVVQNKSVDWNRKEAKNLLNALVLSEDAQKYAIAREILNITKETPLNEAHALLAVIGAFVPLYITVCITQNLYKKPSIFRRAFATFLILFGVGAWIVTKDKVNCTHDENIDKALAEIGPEYINGGKEFYEKLMQRNAALRSLMGSEGEKYFSINGNYNFLLRQPSIPLTHRKSFFESKLQNMEVA